MAKTYTCRDVGVDCDWRARWTTPALLFGHEEAPMKILRSLLAVGAFSVLLFGCAKRDPVPITIHWAWAVSLDADPMGGQVTDQFEIKARVREPGRPRIRRGDYFLAALNIGTQGNHAKYGGVSGLKFTVTYNPSRPSVATYYPASGPPTYVTWYWVKSDGVAITCDNTNKLRFTVSGDGVDDIEIRTNTAGMQPFRVWQNGQPALIFPDHNPNASQVVRYHCLLEEEELF